ncbi:GNAT family N-acetyltransferase, partial [uncultured Methylobacterium sp.]|uniref:GNAT family N-acetyltransferase n=1 Tax=uncultured Methylobacterium sp. TaxID=157278 RepID=UPI0035CA8AF7
MSADLPHGRYHGRLYRHLDEVEAIWRDLEATGSLTAFQLLSWVRGICEALIDPTTEAPVFVTVTERGSGRTVMLLPMLRVQHRTYSELTWIDFDVSDYSGPILAAGVDLDANAAREAWACVRAVLPAVDLIRISRIPGRVAGASNPLLAAPSCRLMGMQAFSAGIAGDAATLVERLARPSAVTELRRRRRKLDQRGEVAFVVASTPDEVDRIVDALVEQRRERFQSVGRPNLLERGKVADFYRTAAHRGLSGGPVRLMGLSVDGTWIAAVYGLVHANAFHMVIPTMREGEWKSYAPGLQSIAAAMEWSRVQGLDTFDFTIGHIRFKTDFGGIASDLYEIHEARTLRGHMVMRGTQAAEAGKAWIKRRP